ncbi:uncharacterized protein IL334_001661 [Kwoniella shivajii]|uniref:Phosphatidate cytidylyltransferase, mitochondrial n=1 Tax=Kwoniella shivajii TaxID=564305 RepID=A0ABZ1CTP4_9TREE|nr:hypothetical protein IL334_001661 [Kwoniella shivajii]
MALTSFRATRTGSFLKFDVPSCGRSRPLLSQFPPWLCYDLRPSSPIRYRSRRTIQSNPSIRIAVRFYVTEKLHQSPSDQQASYHRLRPIIDTFEAPIDWAVAYGSGVMKQAKAKPGDPPSLTDLLISTPSAIDFHTINLRQNPSHYPLHARLMGAGRIAHVQENWGAGVWYVTDVKLNGTAVKYGIISTSSLITDLVEWETFYLSGRLQKPTLSLQSPSSSSTLTSALETNHKSALSMALLLCPESFEEDYLWEKIAGLSYSGDPRMSVPGAENPEKVRNIVRGEGAREGFRHMYGPFLLQKGVTFDQGKELIWKENGETSLNQPISAEHQAELFSSLPLSLRKAISTHFPSIEATALTGKDVWIKDVGDPRFRSIISTELRNIIHRPALRQSVKGLFTAGFTKSFWYALAKVRKWFKGRGGK